MNNKEKQQLQKEVLDSLSVKPHGRLLLCPRSGKTKLIIDLIKRDKPESILWVTLSSKLAEEDIPNEFKKWKALRYLKKLTTSTYASLNKIKGDFDIVIFDEDQHITENNIENFLNKSISYNNIISMTGTNTKHRDKRELYDKLGLKVLYEISINSGVDIGLLSNYTINVVKVDMSLKRDIEAGNKQKRFMTSEKSQYEYLDKVAKKSINKRKPDIKFRVLARMRAIKNSPSKLEAAKYIIRKMTSGRKLIFSSTIKQAEELSEYRYHSKTNNYHLKRFQEGLIDEISMVNAGGTGFTYKELDHLIIVQSDSDKNGLTSQKVCRTLLSQKNYQATIWFICLIKTKDEDWVKSALESFDSTKINYLSFKDIVV